MDLVLWIIQWLLTVMLLAFGSMKLIKSKQELSEKMAWVEDFSQATIKSIGALQVFTALCLAGAALLDIGRDLIPYAAAGVELIMIGAIFVHFKRGEKKEMLPPFVVFLIAASLAIGRLFIEPF